MATIVTRAGKGSPLTHDEVDSNFNNLNTDKVETSAIGTAAAADTGDFATAAQGALADSAIQSGDLATVATTGAYADLTGKPTLGTAAATASTDYATAAQGTLADSAVQPNDSPTFAGIDVTGTITTDGLTVDGLRVGRGEGDISTNTALGLEALNSNTTGSTNTAVGRDALYFNTTGTANTANGYQALRANTTGTANTASGWVALRSNTTGKHNTAFGSDALRFNTTGTANTANGYQALRANTAGSHNTASGWLALRSNTTGNFNVAVGRDALKSNTTGGNNTANGYQALVDNTTGLSNTAFGWLALSSNTTGDYNTASGREALKNNTTGSGNFGVAFLKAGGAYSPVFDPTTENNRVVMGHTGVTNAYVQVAWTVVSDERDKTEIAPLEKGLDFIKQLNPVSYKFRKDRDTEETVGGKKYGFLAQDVLEVEGEDNVIVDNEDPNKLKMTHEELIPVLVNAIKEQQEMIAALENRVTELEKRL